ncbi:MAG: OpgC family protein [Hyphomicrobiaceae bacterium]
MTEPSRLNSTRPRDPRVDFFRGLALIIIFIVHVPMNPLGDLMPGKFGFSDSAEIFVFCSGLAAAFAYGRIYDNEGFAAGTVQVGRRVWHLYWAHIAIFLVIVSMNVQFDRWAGTGTMFVDGFNHGPFLVDQSGEILTALLTLRYVPNFFDILPTYIVVMAMVPLVMALARISTYAVAAFVYCMWIIGDLPWLELPAEPWSDRVWFFDPFSWQMLFFVGFAIGRGWLPAPPRRRWAVALALAIIIASVPFAHHGLYNAIGFSAWTTEIISRLNDKTHLGVARVVHFAALAYVAFYVSGPLGDRLHGQIARFVRVVGSQALPVFLVGQVLSVLGGFILQMTAMATLAVVVVNVAGVLVLYAVAVTMTTVARKRAQAVPVLARVSD